MCDSGLSDLTYILGGAFVVFILHVLASAAGLRFAQQLEPSRWFGALVIVYAILVVIIVAECDLWDLPARFLTLGAVVGQAPLDARAALTSGPGPFKARAAPRCSAPSPPAPPG